MKIFDKVSGWFRSAKENIAGKQAPNETENPQNTAELSAEDRMAEPASGYFRNQGYHPGQQSVQEQPRPQVMQQACPASAAQPAFRQQPSGVQAPAQPNVLEFPRQKQEQAPVFNHYVMLLRSREQCKEVIGYIKNNAAVFLNMEYIAVEGDRQRCVDVLSGAAYTLGCTITKISPRGTYLISPPSVNVVIDDSMKAQSPIPETPAFMRQRRGSAFRQAMNETTPMQQQPAMPMQQPAMPMQQAAMPVQSQAVGMEAPLHHTAASPTERFASPIFRRPREMGSSDFSFAGSQAGQV